MPERGIKPFSHDQILRYEEIEQVVKAASKLGIKKIKVTGGEPLVRGGVVTFIKRLKDIEGIEEVTLTTNGVLLKDMAKDLKEARLDGVNISLDTLDPITYAEITRRDVLSEVLDGIEEAVSSRIKVKINCVGMRDFNENQLIQVAGLAEHYPIDIRFIELMPIGLGKQFSPIANEEILNHLEQVYKKATLSHKKHGNGPACYYDFQGFKGSIGFIGAVSTGFCSRCNRIRLTATGRLKQCLHYNQGIELRPLIRKGISIEELKDILQEVIYHKPLHHGFNKQIQGKVDESHMAQIGG